MSKRKTAQRPSRPFPLPVVPAPAMSSGPPAKRSDGRFDWGANENDALDHVVIDTAVEAGHPWNGALFQLACANKAFHQECMHRVDKMLGELRKLYDNMLKALVAWRQYKEAYDRSLAIWRSTNSVEERPAMDSTMANEYDCTVTLFEMACKNMLGSEGIILSDRLRKVHNLELRNSIGSWKFDFNHKTIAHALQKKCMLCTGYNKPCVCDSKSSKGGISPWQWNLFQGSDFVYCNSVCVSKAAIAPEFAVQQAPPREAVDHLLNDPKNPETSRKVFSSWALSQAMFHQAGIYDLEAARKVVYASSSRVPILIRDNRNFQMHSIEARLKLSPHQVEGALAESVRVTTLRDKEEAAKREVRLNKLRDDCDAYLLRTIGETVASLGHTLPTVERTVDDMLYRITENNEYNSNFYSDATATHLVRWTLEKLVVLKETFTPMDLVFRGAQHPRHSSQSYEWLFDLTGGALSDRVKSLRYHMDTDVKDYWTPHGPTARDMDLFDHVDVSYMLAAAHVFDCIGSDFSLHIETRQLRRASISSSSRHPRPTTRVLDWALRHRNGWSISGAVGECSWHRSWHRACEMNQMAWGCLREAACAADGMGDLRLRPPPCQSKWRLRAKPNGANLHALEEVREYYEEAAGTLVLFEATRHAGLLLLGISSIGIAEALRQFHTDWATGKAQVSGQAQCPHSARDFALWLCGNPAGHSISWNRAPSSPPPVPPLPEAAANDPPFTKADLVARSFDDSDSDVSVDSASSSEFEPVPYEPGCCLEDASPQYEPTSPQYEPGSPQYDPTSPQYNPDPSESDAEALDHNE